jgi:hypothetical protein
MKIKNQKDFWAGIMFIVFGLFFAGFGAQYTFGTTALMGPGYFPRALAAIVILIGIVTSTGSLSAGAIAEKIEMFDFSALLLILGAVVLFGLLLKPLGLIASLIILVAISSYASHEFSWKDTLINAASLTMICLLVFVWALKLRFQIWPSFIGN